MKSPCNISTCNWYTFKVFIKKWRGLPQRANFRVWMMLRDRVMVRVRVRVGVGVWVRVGLRVG